MSVLSGAIICESLKPGTVLDLDDMRVTRWSRYAVDDRADYQPPVWTLIEFEAPEALSDILAEKLAAATATSKPESAHSATDASAVSPNHSSTGRTTTHAAFAGSLPRTRMPRRACRRTAFGGIG